MVGIRFHRKAKNSWRSAAVWAMLPLALLNGRTVVGCGCRNQFEAVCHCNCDEDSTSCGSQQSSCTCRAKHSRCYSATAETVSKEANATINFICNGCKLAIIYEVLPATVISIHDVADHVVLSASMLDGIDLPSAVSERVGVPFVEYSTPKPVDLVVTLRRFII